MILTESASLASNLAAKQQLRCQHIVCAGIISSRILLGSKEYR